MSETIIQTTGLTKRYGEVTAVDSLDLSIEKGEVFGLLGPNGAGKTTTTLMLLGLTDPTSGTAVIAGHNCTREPIEVKRIVGYLPDNVGFYPEMTGRQNLVFTGEMNGLDRKEAEKRAEELLERVGMTYAADRPAGKYSRGMWQRLGIADVLMKDPQIIIMDEPTLGIDPEGMRELIKLIRELSDKDGRTILISSHQLYQIQQICDRVGIFVGGKLIACGRIDELGRQLMSEGLYQIDVKVDPDSQAVRAILEKIPGVKEVAKQRDGSYHIESSSDIRREVTGSLLMQGFTLIEMRSRGGDLDEIYRKYFEKAGEENGRDNGDAENAGIGGEDKGTGEGKGKKRILDALSKGTR